MSDLGQAPAHLRGNNFAPVLQDVTAGLGVARPAHVSLRGGKFRLVNAAGAEFLVPTHHLDVIVIGAQYNASRVFYGVSYDESDPQPPVCWSDNGTGPSVNSIEPQAPTCAVCPQNQRGTDTTFTGKPTTACTKKKKLAVIIPGDPAVNVYEFQVPIASLSTLRQYHDWVSQQSVPGLDRRLDVSDVVTRVSWDDQKNFRLKFSPVGWTDERSVQVIGYVHQNKLMDVPLGRNDVAMDPERVTAFLASRPTQAALPPPAAQAPAQQFTLPPPPQQATDPHRPPQYPPQFTPTQPQQNWGHPATQPPGQWTPPPQQAAPQPQQTATVPAKRTRGPNKPKTVAPSPQSTLQQPTPAPVMRHSEQFAAPGGGFAVPQPIAPPQQGWQPPAPPQFSQPSNDATLYPPNDPGPIPPALQRAPGPRQDAPVPPAPQGGFGMVGQPPPPPQGIQAALDAAMAMRPPQG